MHTFRFMNFEKSIIQTDQFWFLLVCSETLPSLLRDVKSRFLVSFLVLIRFRQLVLGYEPPINSRPILPRWPRNILGQLTWLGSFWHSDRASAVYPAILGDYVCCQVRLCIILLFIGLT